MLNLLGCNKRRFFKINKKMNYSSFEKMKILILNIPSKIIKNNFLLKLKRKSIQYSKKYKF